jgi:hypothetical protein
VSYCDTAIFGIERGRREENKYKETGERKNTMNKLKK